MLNLEKTLDKLNDMANAIIEFEQGSQELPRTLYDLKASIVDAAELIQEIYKPLTATEQ